MRGALHRLILFGSIFPIFCSPSLYPQPLRRVVLVVPDGAGAGHWAVARIALESLIVEAFPVIGLVDTRGSDHIVTGSAPSATAFAIGVRTRMGMIGLGPDSQPRQTVLEAAQEQGMATGLITTTLLTDATPAAFASHVPRRDHLIVARQFAQANVDVMLGGGRVVFEYLASDGQPPALEAMRDRYTYVTSADELDAVDLGAVDKLLGLFAEQDMALAPERSPSLAEMTAVALEVLDRASTGFFLLVETEETDTQAHYNRPFDVISEEMRALDEAIRVVVAYHDRHPETLIVVVGDHETGGLTVHADSLGHPVVRYTTTGHTAELVPLFALGPGAERFGGILANDQVGRLLLDAVRR